MSYTCIHSKDGLIPADILVEIAAGETPVSNWRTPAWDAPPA